MIIIVMYKKRHVIAVYFSVVDKQQIKEGNDDRDSFFFLDFFLHFISIQTVWASTLHSIAFYER